MANITIITDAWTPQVNGVVTTYLNTVKHLQKMGHAVTIIEPSQFSTVAMPGYKEIRLSLNPWKMKNALNAAIRGNDYFHVATEGPLGLYARLYLSRKGVRYTTCYHTKFPEFIKARTGVSPSITYPFYRWFHSKSSSVMVPTKDMATFLTDKGFKNIRVWTRGVDTDKFLPTDIQSRYIICVSRVSQEKNLDAFCSLKYPHKIVIGDGPYLLDLMVKYPDVLFFGKLSGEELVKWYASARAFVFPSREDTFGLVMLESIACGTPVAAYPSPGANEVINNDNGCVSEYLDLAVDICLTKDRKKVRESALSWSWSAATVNFMQVLTLP